MTKDKGVYFETAGMDKGKKSWRAP